MTAQTSLQVARSSEGYVVLVVGRGTMKLAPTFRAFAERCIANGKAVLVSTEECCFLDSTFLGSLVAVHKQCQRQAIDFRIIADDAKRQQLFMNSMLHRVLKFRTKCPADLSELQELPCEPCEADRFGEILVSSHQQLADIQGPDSAQFQSIADQLRAEQNKRR